MGRYLATNISVPARLWTKTNMETQAQLAQNETHPYRSIMPEALALSKLSEILITTTTLFKISLQAPIFILQNVRQNGKCFQID